MEDRMNRKKRWPKGTWMRLRSPETLQALMRQYGFSLKDLAETSGCSKGFISHLLAGRRSSCTTELAERIARALHIPIEVLFEARLSTSTMPVDKNEGSAA
jgi:transcriptional regulator with XRE-family HTH domain